jgi:MFS family permease
MTDRDRRGWIVVGAIFIATLFIWGAINSSAVFFVPLLNHFHWSRETLSKGFSVGWVTGGLAGPLIGWGSEKVNPKWMMVIGATVTGLLWVALSHATTFGQFVAINGTFGISVGAATTIPSSLVIASWFERQRGLAIGIAFAAAPIGGAAMTPLVNHIIATAGWRAGYLALGLPILLVVVPLVLFFVRPGSVVVHSDPATAAAAAAIPVPGFDLLEAASTRSFWVICAVQLLIGTTLGMYPHYIAYLRGAGYTAGSAANAYSGYFVMTTFGALLGGPFADRAGARGAMIATCAIGLIGNFGLMTASSVPGLMMNILAGGFALGAFGVEMPLVIIESLGVKRFASLMGVTGVCYTAGAAVSPIIAGRIFDTTHSYAMAIEGIAVALVLSAITLFGCRTFASHGEQVPSPAPSAAA